MCIGTYHDLKVQISSHNKPTNYIYLVLARRFLLTNAFFLCTLCFLTYHYNFQFNNVLLFNVVLSVQHYVTLGLFNINVVYFSYLLINITDHIFVGCSIRFILKCFFSSASELILIRGYIG